MDYKKCGDSLSIYLDRDQSIQLLSIDDLFGAVAQTTACGAGMFTVSQQYKSIFGISGDGNFCDLQSPVYLSDWKPLSTEYDPLTLPNILKNNNLQCLKLLPKISKN